MKKFLSIIVMLTVLIIHINISSARDIVLYLDGTKVECEPGPVIINSRTMIPARAVFASMGASVSWEEATRTVKVNLEDTEISMVIDSDVAYVNGSEKTLDSPPLIKDSRTMIPLRFVGESIGANVLWNQDKYAVYITSPEDEKEEETEEAEEEPSVIIDDISFKKGKDADVLSMTSSGDAEIAVMSLENPSRAVLDIKNALLVSYNGQYEGTSVRQVRYASHEGFVRVVCENDTMPGFVITDNNGYIEMKFLEERGNFDYIGIKQYELIFEKGAEITCEDYGENIYTFHVSGADIGEESLKINDDVVKEVSSYEDGGVKITLSRHAACEISDNKIMFIPVEEGKREDTIQNGLVVLDAGHGGVDPGALGYSEDKAEIIAYEKDMNLSITLMVYDILKSNGVKVALTRNDDTYVGLSERAEFANQKNAELFVSIHNNSIAKEDYTGTMVLYSLQSMGGKRLANNILDGILKSASTVDRGLRNGTNMAVIRKTAMPAVIVECGFLTNYDELLNLMDEEFQEKLAEGIAEGIMKTLGI